jgi:hypothetical protein
MNDSSNNNSSPPRQSFNSLLPNTITPENETHRLLKRNVEIK